MKLHPLSISISKWSNDLYEFVKNKYPDRIGKNSSWCEDDLAEYCDIIIRKYFNDRVDDLWELYRIGLSAGAFTSTPERESFKKCLELIEYPAWCEHIHKDYMKGWLFTDKLNTIALRTEVSDNWRSCPVCFANRPEEK